MEEKVGGYISKVHFNDGTILNTQKNSIIVFVGPNNAGKSQALRDIFTICKDKVSSIVVSDIEIAKSTQPIEGLLDSISTRIEHGSYATYEGLNGRVSVGEYTDKQFQKSKYFGDFRDLFVANLDTSARLTICNAAESIARSAPKRHPIHYAAFENKYRKWLSDNFKKAFGVGITPNILYGASIPLCIGEPIRLDGTYEDEQDRQEEYAERLALCDQVQNQGDGVKSFTGILLYLMLDYFCTFLIDEPESFLHPPQARIMGQIIGESLADNQQAFISTHSEDIIKGIVETCPDRVSIVRITRNGNTNHFSILSSQMLQDIWDDSLLRHSNIMSSLFHKSIVLCESDSDCKMYSLIENQLKKEGGSYSETLFIHCGGKDRIAKVVSALRSLDIDVKVIVDIDVLNNEQVLRAILRSFGIDWNNIEPDYNKIVANLHSPNESIDRSSAKASINAIFDNSKSKCLTNSEINRIRNVISTTSKWTAIKNGGISALPPGDATRGFRNIDLKLRQQGIYIVSAGELECFIKEVGGHGPEWVNKVLEAYPNLGDAIYTPIRDFVSSMNL